MQISKLRYTIQILNFRYANMDFFKHHIFKYTVFPKRSWIQDLVLLRTKLLKWSPNYVKFLQKALSICTITTHSPPLSAPQTPQISREWKHHLVQFPISLLSPQTFTTPLSRHSSLPRKQHKKYGFNAGEKSVMEYGGAAKSEASEIGGELEANWRRTKMSTSKALSGWIEGWAVLRGFLRCVAFQICAILAHP